LAIADIHLATRAKYVVRLHTDDETRSWFGSVVGNRPSAWWLARQGGRVVGYMLIDGEHHDHLYVHPEAQGRGVGSTSRGPEPQTRQFDPLLPFKIGPTNGREPRGSGLRLKAWITP
jgi:GNAT superfamily N-acetyltransferase